MISLVDDRPIVALDPLEYVRLLGFPQGWVLEGRARELADWAREWHAANGRPWVRAYQVSALDVGTGTTFLDGEAFGSARLQRTLDRAGAHTAVIAAVSAGPELEQEARRLWDAERPDEYFFLEVYGSAVVEHLVTTTGARLCAIAEEAQMAVLPHDSPGYAEWAVSDQSRLLAVLIKTARRFSTSSCADELPLDVLDSGMLRPKKSLLAVFGLTRHVDRVQRLTELQPCENCSYPRCAYRRARYRRSAEPETATASASEAAAGSPAAPPLSQAPAYAVSIRALKRWAAERLSLRPQADGTLVATFRYEGTTCTNSGRTLEFEYTVFLGSRAGGYVIRDGRCVPAPGDTGHTAMCRYISHRDELMGAIVREQPLRGRPINDVLTWSRPSCPAGCYCDAEARDHKWGLVLETIHYALAHADEAPGLGPSIREHS